MRLLPTECLYESRDEWLERRGKCVGASEVAALFGIERPYQMSHWTLWQVKSGRLNETQAGFTATDRTKWGLRLEDTIMEAVAEEQGWERWRRAGYCYHPRIPRFGCTPDYFVLDGETPRVMVDTKNVDSLIYRDEWPDGEPPPHILMQMQTQMACTGFESATVAGLIGGNRKVAVVVERRPKIIAAIEEAVEAFWDSIDRNQPPPIDGKANTAVALRNLNPSMSGKVFEANDNVMGLITKYQLVNNNISQAQKDLDLLRNQIYEAIEDAEIIKHEGQVVMTAKSHDRKGFEVKPSRVRTIRFPRA